MNANVRWSLLLGALVLPLGVIAQGSPGPGTGPGAGRMRAGAGAFDPQSVTTIKGEVLDVQRIARGRRGLEGVHLIVKSGDEKVNAHLGPDFYVDQQALKPAQGDQVEVKGARTSLDGEAVLLAQEVRRGEEVLALRDSSGLPLWRGEGTRRRR
ncbi:MAG TPA: hypothetical protein VD838_07640 [Anaeromyxobacteraceae bacterium]|nr:hypothetical protein [Anaeromyxobacteraceae bacterium]